VLAFNRDAAADAYTELTQRLGADPETLARAWLRRLGLVSPFAGQPVADREAIVQETLASGSTAANPRPVSAADVERILDAVFEG
jgi:alcohol dehydrogenase class IV